MRQGEAEGWHLRYEEAVRDKKANPHKYIRRWFRKKGEKPAMAMVRGSRPEDSAETIADVMDRRAAEDMRRRMNLIGSGVKGRRR
jgi:hypothetical protein